MGRLQTRLRNFVSDALTCVTSINGRNGDVALTKIDVGLDQVDNTSDVNKPISTAQQAAFDLKANNADLTTHASNTANPHAVTKSQVGLGNVDNTSDANKPVSTAQQTALNLKANATDLTSHTSSTSNPHGVTAAQTGAETTSQLNARDTANRNRANHTGTQAQSTVVNLMTDLADKAPLASPALTGTPTAPTATAGTNTTQLATTAFVTGAISTNATADRNRANHTGTQAQSTVTNLVTDLATKAPLASPALTGTPTAPTATAGTNTTQVATTAFVKTLGDTKVATSSIVNDLTTGGTAVPLSAQQGVVLKDLVDGKASAGDLAALTAHTANTSNPHGVTKTQVGLSNVPNIDATNASNLSAGTVPAARLASASETTNGVVEWATQAEVDAGTATAGNQVVRAKNLRMRFSGTNMTVGGTLGTNGYSASIGVSSMASGNQSMASGIFSTASGLASTASGAYSVASGSFSTASGSFSIASGYQSTASGAYSTASHRGSVVTGAYLISGNIGENVTNPPDTNTDLHGRLLGFSKLRLNKFTTYPITLGGSLGNGYRLETYYDTPVELQSGDTYFVDYSINYVAGDGSVNRYKGSFVVQRLTTAIAQVTGFAILDDATHSPITFTAWDSLAVASPTVPALYEEDAAVKVYPYLTDTGFAFAATNTASDSNITVMMHMDKINTPTGYYS